MAATALERVVELNEQAKVLRRYAFEVSLRALGATVRSSRSGTEQRGFNEVAGQMRSWSRALESAVQEITGLAARRVHIVSDLARVSRLSNLLAKAGAGQADDAPIVQCALRERSVSDGLEAQLRQTDALLEESLDGVAQLGLMASVLSRAALIEAASGAAQDRQELSLASREFATYAESVNAAISVIRRRNGAQPS